MPEYFKAMIAGLVFFIAAGPATAELFQYKDQNGITRLTDNIYSVPVAFRSQLEAYSEIEELPQDMDIQPLEKMVPQPPLPKKARPPKTHKAQTEKPETNIISPAIPGKSKAAIVPAMVPEKTESESEKPEMQKNSPSPSPPPLAKSAHDTGPKTPPANTVKTIAPEKITPQPAIKSKIKPEIKNGRPALYTSKIITIAKDAPPPEAETSTMPSQNMSEQTIPEPEITLVPGERSEPVKKKALDTELSKHPDIKSKKTTVIEPLKPEDSAAFDADEKTGRVQKPAAEKAIIADKTASRPAETLPAIINKTINEAKETNTIKPETARRDILEPTALPDGPSAGIKPANEQVKAATALTEDKTKEKPKAKIQKAPAENRLPEPDTRLASSYEPEISFTSDTAGRAAEPQAQSAAANNEPEDSPEPANFDEKDEDQQLAYLQTTRKTLADKKEALNREYMELMEEKEKLEKSVDEDDEKSVREYNKNVKILNIKIKQYKNKKKALQAEIETYNSLIHRSSAN